MALEQPPRIHHGLVPRIQIPISEIGGGIQRNHSDNRRIESPIGPQERELSPASPSQQDDPPGIEFRVARQPLEVLDRVRQIVQRSGIGGRRALSIVDGRDRLPVVGQVDIQIHLLGA